uniref:Uncharacterized protein n=1 Tax=Solanum lycopersicum TaxID=4081 RepID=A0A3Q7HLX0_SOLLC|nr:uncharacterized protein LOC101265566 [Solanum lycopersicum]
MSVSMIMDKREVEGSCGFMDALSCNPQEAFFGGNKQVYINEEKACTCSSSSSIGENSDTISHEESMDDDPQEVESPFSSIQSLHQVLPIRKGMSRFYNGKSKSFTSLREASTSSSVKELAKPENVSYINKKRRNILACRLPNNKNHTGISKKKHIGILAMNSGLCDNSTSWRSFSLADLQFVSVTTTPTILQQAEKKPTN